MEAAITYLNGYFDGVNNYWQRNYPKREKKKNPPCYILFRFHSLTVFHNQELQLQCSKAGWLQPATPLSGK